MSTMMMMMTWVNGRVLGRRNLSGRPGGCRAINLTSENF